MHATRSTLVTALGFASLAWSGPVTTRQQDFTACLINAGLSPLTPSSDGFDSATAAYNQRLQPTPAAFIQPQNASEVSSAIKCASDAGVPVSARSGGHSYASFAFGGVDQHVLTIDLANFKDITIDELNIAKVGSGNKLGDVALKLNEKNRGMPHGVCPWVGVGGHASYGGFGLASRDWGLMLDNVEAFDVVLANGTFIEKLTRNIDPDLFWALAGAAPNYGVVTSFYFRTYEAPSTGVVFSYNWYGLDPSTMTNMFLAFQDFGRNQTPSAMGISVVIGKGGSFEISGAHYATRDVYNETIAPLLAKVPGGYEAKVESKSWIDTLQDLAGSQSLDTSTGSGGRDAFFAKSLMTPEDPSQALTETALNAYFQYLTSTQTDTNWFVEINTYGGENSAINAVSTDFNSFAWRDRLLTFQMYASSSTYGLPYPSDGVNFVNGMYGALVSPMLDKWGSTAAYINYVDPTLSDDQVVDQYWGNQHDRLSKLKARYDPNQVFRNPQSIKPAQSST